MLGIDQLKKNLLTLGKIVKAVDGALEDKKVTTAEGIGIAFKAIDVIGVIKNLKAAKDEFNDLSDEEFAELTELFKKEFDLRNDKAEQLIESVVSIAFGVAKATGVFSKE